MGWCRPQWVEVVVLVFLVAVLAGHAENRKEMIAGAQPDLYTHTHTQFWGLSIGDGTTHSGSPHFYAPYLEIPSQTPRSRFLRSF